MYHRKYFIIFAIILSTLLGYKTYEQYHTISKTQNIIIQNQSKTLIDFVKSFRKTYQNVFLKENISIDNKTIHLLPVKTTPMIAKIFAKAQNNDITIKTVSDKPRNPSNLANAFEMEMIQYFKLHPKKQYKFIKKQNSFIFIEPLYIEKSCLKCHGKREDAIASIKNKYSTAYDYKLGELRGLIDVEIKNRGYFDILYINFKNNLVINIAILIGLLIIIYILLNSMRKKELTYRQYLENEIDEKTTKIAQQKDTLYYQANHDSLTKLPNRTLFLKELKNNIQKAKENNTNLAIFFIDLDQFKQINDSLGHDIGDKVLQIAAKRLKSKIRSNDLLARLGGDEFVAIINDFKDMRYLSTIASNILKVTKEPIHIDEHILYISSSIGISTYPKDATNEKDLLKFADTAMYKAKDEGRNNYQFYDIDMTKKAYEKIVIKSELKQALLKNEFMVYLQPQIDISTNKLIGMEALSRWGHPQKGLLTPNKYIDLAISTGVIVDIDRMMIDKSMHIFATWYNHNQNPGTLSLNITVSNIVQDDFIDYINSSMEKYSFQPQWLILEVTENEVMQKHHIVADKLQQLNDLGISIAIDDFGIGYSSLSYLKQLPVKKIKIDRSFVFQIPDQTDDVSIVKAIIALANNLELDIMAEGVETQKQKEFLEENGCTNIQGFFYDKPMLPDMIEKKYL